MPRIEVIELWSSEPGSSSSFCLDVGRDGQAEISWRSTWDHGGSAIKPETVRAWNLVARKENVEQGRCSYDLTDATDGSSHEGFPSTFEMSEALEGCVPPDLVLSTAMGMSEP